MILTDNHKRLLSNQPVRLVLTPGLDLFLHRNCSIGCKAAASMEEDVRYEIISTMVAISDLLMWIFRESCHQRS